MCFRSLCHYLNPIALGTAKTACLEFQYGYLSSVEVFFFFTKLTFQESNSLDPDQAQHFVGPHVC